eukprot:TRINITY_DN4119_c5_g1_i1.p1 TRINITY_DN4119_c5_g1~~TRINITY_DN4119_c5_g1_i1.p1  ORF type:complete len:412 (+),score=41.64 TRINITY_DN4119_c5_g1_i1:215-1450(+)
MRSSSTRDLSTSKGTGQDLSLSMKIDEQESKIEHKPVHVEENCENCWQGDVALPPHLTGEGISLLQAWANMSVTGGGKAWPQGLVYYRWRHDMSSLAKEVTLTAMRVWSSKTCVRFEEVGKGPCTRIGHPSCFPVTIGSHEDGCFAIAGYYGADFHKMNLGRGCEQVGTAIHELGHVLGLMHEHERKERDEYVEVHLENVQQTFHDQFLFAPWRDSKTASLPYDLSSIMHYDEWAFAQSPNYNDPKTKSISVKKKDSWGNCKIGQRTQISIGDALTISTLYQCPTEYCADINIACPRFDRTYCSRESKYYDFMAKNCRATCGMCQCKDTNEDEKCDDYARRGYCPHGTKGNEENRQFMREQCSKSCGLCGPTDFNCQDKKGKDCSRSGCQTFWELHDCPRTCNTCPAQVFC